jgi:transforming growth factor-beta-induced protein
MADDPVVTAAGNNPQLSTLASTIESAGLVDTLNGEGPFTIFAPSNSAFAAIPPADLEAVLADPSGVLTDLFTLHVVVGQQLSTSDLAAAGTVDSLGGTLTIDSFGDRLTVDAGAGPAVVVCGDIQTANATVHIVDAVLLPGS